MLAALDHAVCGATIHRSIYMGRTWQMSTGPAFPAGSELKLKRNWRVDPGHASRPKQVWAGADPGALFKSVDGGETWQPVLGLIEHPSHGDWFPGARRLLVHCILPHPTDPNRLYVALSAAGVFRSDDGGQTWAPKNKGLRPAFCLRASNGPTWDSAAIILS